MLERMARERGLTASELLRGWIAAAADGELELELDQADVRQLELYPAALAADDDGGRALLAAAAD